KSSKNRFIASNNAGAEIAKIVFISMTYDFWCARRDSNPHDFTHCHLKAARLPIPPRALGIPAGRTSVRRINGADVTNQGWRDKAVLRLNNYLTSGDFGSICLTSTAMRLRSTSTTP